MTKPARPLSRYYKVRYHRKGYGVERCSVTLWAADPSDAMASVRSAGVVLTPSTMTAEPAGTVSTMLAQGTPGGVYPRGALGH